MSKKVDFHTVHREAEDLLPKAAYAAIQEALLHIENNVDLDSLEPQDEIQLQVQVDINIYGGGDYIGCGSSSSVLFDLPYVAPPSPRQPQDIGVEGNWEQFEDQSARPFIYTTCMWHPPVRGVNSTFKYLFTFRQCTTGGEEVIIDYYGCRKPACPNRRAVVRR